GRRFDLPLTLLNFRDHERGTRDERDNRRQRFRPRAAPGHSQKLGRTSSRSENGRHEEGHQRDHRRAKGRARSDRRAPPTRLRTGANAARYAGQERREERREQFDNLDTGWLEVVNEKLKLAFKGKHPFIRHQASTDFHYAMNNQVTVALLADWGGGNDHATNVGNEVRKRNPDIVIHLSDVYYAGTESEVQKRFLDLWPGVQQRGRSFALNSNHEMYSGGYSYFDLTLKAFQQEASYFCLENDNWRLIGLDTGYVEHDLTQDQVEWLAALLNDGSNKTNILLSHHQLYSGYEALPSEIEGEKRLFEWLKGFLQAGQIPHWFWGHEHLCVIYKKFQGVKGRCVGHGCFPYSIPSATPPLPG